LFSRSIGANIFQNFPSYHWLYWIAPLCGAVLAVGIYKVLKFLQYENNLGPDADGDGFTHDHHNDLRERLDRIEALLSQRRDIAV
jgi:aquaporin related protein